MEILTLSNIRIDAELSEQIESQYKAWCESLPEGVQATKSAFLRGLIEKGLKK